MLALELAWGAQVAACAAYAYGLFGKRGGGSALARGLLGAAWLGLTAWLLWDWKVAGLWQPPWLSLADTMLMGSWALLTAQLIGELRMGASEAGFFCTAWASVVSGTAVIVHGLRAPAVASGLGAISRNPMLHNPWIWVHVPSGALAYGLFLLSVFFSILALVRLGVRGDRFLSVLAGVSLLLLSSGAQAGQAATVAALGFALLLTLSVLGFWLESQDRRLNEELARSQPGAAAGPGAPRERRGLRRLLRLIFGVSWLALVYVTCRVACGFAREVASEPRAAGSPGFFIGLALLAVLGGAALALLARQAVLEERLPEPEALDRWSFRAALYAFPLLTMHLVSGSVWGYDAWGSYWSWQPQSSWVLMAWLYLALILHLKRGKVSTAVATCAGMIWVLAAVAAAGAYGFGPVH